MVNFAEVVASYLSKYLLLVEITGLKILGLLDRKTVRDPWIAISTVLRSCNNTATVLLVGRPWRSGRVSDSESIARGVGRSSLSHGSVFSTAVHHCIRQVYM